MSNNIPQATVSYGNLPNGCPCQMYTYRKNYYLDIEDAAKAINKQVSQIHKWLATKNYFSHDFLVGDRLVWSITIETFAEFIRHEAKECDNFNADVLHLMFLEIGLNALIGDQKEGYFELTDNKVKIHFHTVDGQRVFDKQDLIRAFETTEEEFDRVTQQIRKRYM